MKIKRREKIVDGLLCHQDDDMEPMIPYTKRELTQKLVVTGHWVASMIDRDAESRISGMKLLVSTVMDWSKLE
jgi:hypothetical protein